MGTARAAAGIPPGHSTTNIRGNFSEHLEGSSAGGILPVYQQGTRELSPTMNLCTNTAQWLFTGELFR